MSTLSYAKTRRIQDPALRAVKAHAQCGGHPCLQLGAAQPAQEHLRALVDRGRAHSEERREFLTRLFLVNPFLAAGTRTGEPPSVSASLQHAPLLLPNRSPEDIGNFFAPRFLRHLAPCHIEARQKRIGQGGRRFHRQAERQFRCPRITPLAS